MDKETILKRFQTVYDPEHPVSILDLKIVTPEDISITDNTINVKVKEGTHVREVMVNQMINDPAQYERTLSNLEEHGLLEQCIGPSM